MRAKPLSIVIAGLLGLAAAPAFAQSPTPAPASPPVTEPAATPPQDPLASDDPDAARIDAAKVPLDEIRRYVMVYNAIRQAYVDPVDDKELMQSAVRGLLLDLDPHSAYMKKADADEFDELTSGAYDGVGLELQQLPEGGVRVVAPIDDGPAERAGLRSRDVIIAIDGKPLVAGEGDASAPLRGKAGTKVVVRIVREGTPKPFDVTLVRETIRTTSVRSRMLEPGFGYVRISSFQAATASDFNKAVDALQKDAPLRGLVLDMRSNPGGLLVGAVQIADELLDKGGIVSTKGRELIGDSRFDATPGDRLKGAPVVVLVDAGSASAANEIAGLAFVNTVVATAAAILGWVFGEWALRGKPSLLGACSGAIAGLVGITPACGYIGVGGALILGIVVGLAGLWGVTSLKRWLRVDDPCDVFGVHGVCGIIGCILTGIFASTALGGVGYAEGVTMSHQVLVQLESIAITIVWSGVVAFIGYKVADLTVGLRVPEDQEREGLDVNSHGENAYNA